ncbi:MAG: alpha/beta hydrolase [Chloroflexi bacterium]|nr:alpha/beta hydrolase [Chloroflexota bacterium]
MVTELVVPQFSLLGLPSEYVDVPGARIHYSTLGEGPPLVMIHGLGSSCTDWFLVSAGLAAHYRLILIDLRGHGQSSLAEHGGYAVSRMAEDVGLVLDHVDIEKTCMLGLSLGGCVILQFALTHGHRVERLVLVNTFAKLRSIGLGSLKHRLSRLYASARDMDLLAQYVAASLYDDPAARNIVYQRFRCNDLGVMRRTMIALARLNLLSQLHTITTPALVLIGDRDATVPRRCAHDLMNRLPRARLRVLRDAGHALPFDQPDLFLKTTLEFLCNSA